MALYNQEYVDYLKRANGDLKDELLQARRVALCLTDVAIAMGVNRELLADLVIEASLDPAFDTMEPLWVKKE